MYSTTTCAVCDVLQPHAVPEAYLRRSLEARVQPTSSTDRSQCDDTPVTVQSDVIHCVLTYLLLDTPVTVQSDVIHCVLTYLLAACVELYILVALVSSALLAYKILELFQYSSLSYRSSNFQGFSCYLTSG